MISPPPPPPTLSPEKCGHNILNENEFKLGQIDCCKDFWDCYNGQGKYWLIADQRVPTRPQ